MRKIAILMVATSAVLAAGCNRQSTTTSKDRNQEQVSVKIELDQVSTENSKGSADWNGKAHQFMVGYGKYGIGCVGSTFEEGVTPLGKFKVNAILSENKFEMDETLIKTSGRTKDYLASHLFKNMSSIDFKGDGKTGEYGSGYISLTPVPPTPQPFDFNTYKGIFRWYSFAIHGTNDESRIGKKVTGGCINMANNEIDKLIQNIKLGDEVVITSRQPCTN